MAASKTPKLEDQAATAALYVTRPERGGQSKNKYPLDDDNKLSSAGAATSLKYANARDLPSYPSAGLTNPDSSAGTAASLANANHTAFEHWKPDPSASASKAANMAKDYKPAPLWHPDHSVSANKAASLAKDYKAAPLWHPETSAAGSQAAALAAKDGGKVPMWRPETTQVGSSAAGQAMRAKGSTPPVDYGYTTEGNKRALLAATGAMSSSRKRAGSSPVVKSSYPDSENSAANALSAATFANKPPVKPAQPKTDAMGGSASVIDAARIHNAAVTNLSREMYTSNPPVAPEVEEKNRQAGLRAAAVSMAKQMYDVQQKAIEEASGADRSDSHHAASSVHRRKASISTDDPNQSPSQYVNLQEAAQKLAAERLAKLHDEHAAYRNYYGANTSSQTRLSIRGRQRQRASSDGQANESDEDRSKQIRSEMSLFNNKVAQVDAHKRQKDRESLMAAAQRNVRASMHGMDEKLLAETGKVSPAMMQSWETNAHARAEADSKARMVNHGMVNIGGGKFLDQADIDAIAAQRVQPTLDEITDKAEKQRARDEQLRIEEQERNELAAAKIQDDKERSLQTKEDWKRFKEEEKRDAKAKKDQEKARKAEEKRLRDEEKSNSKGVKGPEKTSTAISEPPALDPIPKLEPISGEESKLVLAASKSPDSEPKSIEESVGLERTAGLEKRSTIDTADELVQPEYSSRESSELRRVLAEEPTQLDSVIGESDRSETRSLEQPLRAESSAVEDVVFERSIAEESLPAPSTGLSNAELIAARVLSSPVVPDAATEEARSPNAFPDATLPSKPSKVSTKEVAEPSESINHTDPIEVRIAPIAITETTISGPSTDPKSPKSDSKVSAWLKSKFSRRTSKPAKPETRDNTENNSNAPVASTPAVTQGSSNFSLDQDKSSVRDVAMAGKEGLDIQGKRVVDDDLYATPGSEPTKKQQEHASSPTISFSSGEGARGRTELRREETSSSYGDEFEEARDHFDAELTPPAAFKDKGRGSDSPVRDSRFLEDL